MGASPRVYRELPRRLLEDLSPSTPSHLLAGVDLQGRIPAGEARDAVQVARDGRRAVQPRLVHEVAQSARGRRGVYAQRSLLRSGGSGGGVSCGVGRVWQQRVACAVFLFLPGSAILLRFSCRTLTQQFQGLGFCASRLLLARDSLEPRIQGLTP